ncbi:DNA repair protein RadC [Sphingopyxis sp. OAS728]|uniref:JAB domain-containing protein n=1 Tax=Sphingopyxis sp. OAS728 TaxID=2663823 RepID=UPI001789F26A|nr:JAB domain-containing protein [Sphingopyxis sp. OAS728]MBE1526870.1 DNA repair protein RadC [Sphingopyxis sp. OAS728]
MACVEPDKAEIVAARLIAEFRSLARLLSQSPDAIARVVGRDSPVVPLLLVSRDAMREAMRGDLHDKRISASSRKLTDYLKISMGSLPDETLRVLFLDARHRLIADEQMQRGTIDQVVLYPRIILRRAIELDAEAVILVHNHPSGDPTPSSADLWVTERLAAMARSLDITVVDHIVVTATSHRNILRQSRSSSHKTAQSFGLRAEKANLPRADDADDAPGATLPGALANARRSVRRLLLRRQLVGADRLFGEPAWDMLVELFIAHCEVATVPTGALGIGSGLSSSSAQRLVQRLVDARLVVRTPDPDDARRHFVSLSPQIAHRLAAYFVAHDE